MLSSAHVLAMDAKNLLDVVDSLRKRQPELFPAGTVSALSAPSVVQAQPQPSPQSQSTCFQYDAGHVGATDENYQIMKRQQQQQPCDGGDLGPPTELYSNHAALVGALRSPTGCVVSPQCGIYDNDLTVDKQMAAMQLQVDNTSATSTVPSKPPVAAKPTNLHHKLKRQQLPLPRDVVEQQHQLNEPLRIVEEADAADDDDDTLPQQLYSNLAHMQTLLPEPAACAIVQENKFQKVMSNKMT